ncbi:MAG: hypothetical protein HYW07_18595 [Candidatus Latescibacteria bacterium]|nr:hypothetical protein [Candidatus Latescibacterota bacterium]
MDVYRFRQHRRDLAEIGRMYLLIIGLFLLGLLARVMFQATGNPWAPTAVQDSRPSLR